MGPFVPFKLEQLAGAFEQLTEIALMMTRFQCRGLEAR